MRTSVRASVRQGRASAGSRSPSSRDAEGLLAPGKGAEFLMLSRQISSRGISRRVGPREFRGRCFRAEAAAAAPRPCPPRGPSPGAPVPNGAPGGPASSGTRGEGPPVRTSPRLNVYSDVGAGRGRRARAQRGRWVSAHG